LYVNTRCDQNVFRQLFENATLLREILTWGKKYLAPADFFLFSKLKFPLKVRHFQTVEEIQCAVSRELNNISKTAFLECMKKLKERANKCIDQGGMYFEE
jgi:hypothetical protein